MQVVSLLANNDWWVTYDGAYSRPVVGRVFAADDHIEIGSLMLAGCDGDLLCVPKAVSAEDHNSIRAMLVSVLNERQLVFGEMGAPSVVWTDNILYVAFVGEHST